MSMAASGAGYFLTVSWLRNDILITEANRVTWQERSQGSLGWIWGLGTCGSGGGAVLPLFCLSSPGQVLPGS